MNDKGFTLIELLAVIIILAIMLFIAIPSVSNYNQILENTRIFQQLKHMLMALGWKNYR